MSKTYFSDAPFDDRRAQSQVRVKDHAASFTYTLVHHPHHSPDGFAWGYSGSGPTELAKDILWDVLGEKPDNRMYMDFREAFIAPLDMNKGFVLNEKDIRAWLDKWQQNVQMQLQV